MKYKEAGDNRDIFIIRSYIGDWRERGFGYDRGRLDKGNGAAKDAALDALLAWKILRLPTNYLKVCQSAADQVFDRALKRYVQLVSNPASSREENRC